MTGGGVCNTCGNFTDGFSLISWANGWEMREVYKNIAEYLGGNIKSKPKIRVPPKTAREEKFFDQMQMWRNHLIWDQANPLAPGTPGTKYLQHRGLIVPDNLRSVRELTSLEYYHQQDGKITRENHPALVALIVNGEGYACGIHRTYINDNGGKADVPTVKKRTPKHRSTKGASVRLFDPGSILGITEGIETAIAVNNATGMPVWATLSATVMPTVWIPDSVKTVYIWADNDKNNVGQNAALALASNLKRSKKKAIIKVPPLEGTDWLDILNLEGPEGFPA